jgi:hypothetical protein
MLTFADGKSVACRLVEQENYKDMLEIVRESRSLPLLRSYLEGMKYVLLYRQGRLEDTIDATVDTRFNVLQKACEVLELMAVTTIIEEIM